jgi:lipoprotein-anchoring transpeptidase ErfK/SrfK
MAKSPGPSHAARVGRGGWSAREALVVAVAGAATLAAALSQALLIGGTAAGQPSAAAQPAKLSSAAQPQAASSARRSAGSTELATVRATTSRYASPGHLGTGTVPATWYGRPSVLPVIATEPGWVEVRLAQRPNQSTAWLPAADVTLSATADEIVVDLATTTLSLYRDGRLVFTAPAGVGTTDDPTPTGDYFVAFVEQPPQPNPGYGPFILVTSDHSHAISDWEGSGDAVIGIHGPLGEDSQIGNSGAKISHGCIRLHDQALEKLTAVPPGTPVDVVN